MNPPSQSVGTLKWACRVSGLLILLLALAGLLGLLEINSPFVKNNRIFGQTNNTLAKTNNAAGKANSAFGRTNSAFGKANNAFAKTNAAAGKASNAAGKAQQFQSRLAAWVAQVRSHLHVAYGVGGGLLLLGGGLAFIGWRKQKPSGATASASGTAAAPAPAVIPALVYPKHVRNRRWSICNVLHLAPDAKRLWQFDAKGKGFALKREQRVPHAEALPAHLVGKSWSSLWQPRLNVAWLPSEEVFLRIVELPAANAEETFSMVELQLERLSPIPITQIVWTMQVLGTHQSKPKADGTVESLQTVIAVFAARSMVEEFMGRLERDGFLADRLEVPMLDQLEAVQPKGDSVWLFPLTLGGQNAALVAWWFGGAWRNLSFVTLPPAGDRAAELKSQLGLLMMSGEVEGWLAGQPEWHLVADPVNAKEWEQLLRGALGEAVQVSPPPAPADLAGRSAIRAASSTTPASLQPPEFAERYRERFFDRLWLHGLGFAAAVYVVWCAVYFCAAQWEGFQAGKVEGQVAAISGDYTNAIQAQARLAVLQKRSELKFAALDCWQVVAEELPASVNLQRFSFVDGERLALSGNAPQDQLNTLLNFDDSIRKKTVNKEPVFDPAKGDHIAPKTSGNNGYSWNLSLELLHPAGEEK